MSRVYYHSGSFVDHQQNLIFIDHIKWYVFRCQEKLVGWVFKKHLHLIPGLDPIILFDDAVIDPDMTLFCRLLNFVSCGVFDKVHQELIDAKWFLPF